jgi:hypothetical protein
MPLNIDNRSVYDPKKIREEEFLPSTIETIDSAFTEYISETLNIFCTTNEGWKKVPTIWTSAERAFQVKNSKELRDDSGVLIKPVITIERTSLAKDLKDRGSIFSNVPTVNDEKGGSITIARRIKQDKTANFQNARARRLYGQDNFRDGKANKTVYETITIPVPVYVQAMYSVSLYAEYQQQMNEMLTPFITNTKTINAFVLRPDGHFYEGFIQSDFVQTNNSSNLGNGERTYQTTISIKILGYLIGGGKNEQRPKIVRRESAVEVKIPRERVICGDINEFLKENGFYRE